MPINKNEQLKTDLEKAEREYKAADAWKNLRQDRLGGQKGDFSNLLEAIDKKKEAKNALTKAQNALRGNS